MSRIILLGNLYSKFLNSCFYLTLCMNVFTFISHVVSLQFKQPLFFPGFTTKVKQTKTNRQIIKQEKLNPTRQDVSQWG